MLAYTSASTAKRWDLFILNLQKEFMLMDMSMKMLLNIERNF